MFLSHDLHICDSGEHTDKKNKSPWIKASAKCINVNVSRWGIFVAIANNTLYGSK